MFYTTIPTQDVTSPVCLHSFYFMQDVPFLLDDFIFLLDVSNWSCPSLSSTTFWNIPAISALLSEVLYKAMFYVAL